MINITEKEFDGSTIISVTVHHDHYLCVRVDGCVGEIGIFEVTSSMRRILFFSVRLCMARRITSDMKKKDRGTSFGKYVVYCSNQEVTEGDVSRKWRMAVSIMLPPEAIWGYEKVTVAYSERPKESWDRIFEHVREMYPDADDTGIYRLIGRAPG